MDCKYCGDVLDEDNDKSSCPSCRHIEERERIVREKSNMEIYQLRAENKKLREGLEIFGDHQKWSKVNHKEGIDCNCGYEQALKGK